MWHCPRQSASRSGDCLLDRLSGDAGGEINHRRRAAEQRSATYHVGAGAVARLAARVRQIPFAVQVWIYPPGTTIFPVASITRPASSVSDPGAATATIVPPARRRPRSRSVWRHHVAASNQHVDHLSAPLSVFVEIPLNDLRVVAAGERQHGKHPRFLRIEVVGRYYALLA